MAKDDRRSYVRGEFSFKVDYKIITIEEYEALNRFDREIFPPSSTKYCIDTTHSEVITESTADAKLINFLVQIDEKLNRVLNLLSKDSKCEDFFNQGTGLNISGSGIEMLVDSPINFGQIIHLKFLLSKFPYVFMSIFGEVIRVVKSDKDGKDSYHIGIKFIDLSENEREKIITSVFQRQREAIRKNKK